MKYLHFSLFGSPETVQRLAQAVADELVGFVLRHIIGGTNVGMGRSRARTAVAIFYIGGIIILLAPVLPTAW